MKFLAIISTGDGRLTSGNVYQGNIAWVGGPDGSIEIIVYDNKGEWMTFALKAFKPYVE